MDDPYAVLGVKPGVPADELAAAYRSQAKRWHPDRNPDEESVRRMDFELAERAWQTNALGAWRLAVAAIPHMGRGGRIVNVSSQAGSLETMPDDAGMPAYNVSKTALNAITRLLAVELENEGILVNAVCPGWVRTDMGGASASRSVEEGAASVLWAARLGPDGPTGGFFRDGKALAW